MTENVFRKSSFCFPSGDCCVEAGQGDGVIAVRDAADRGQGLVLSFRPDTWTRFTAALK